MNSMQIIISDLQSYTLCASHDIKSFLLQSLTLQIYKNNKPQK